MTAFAISFWVSITVDPDAAASRFNILVASGADGRAIGHGEQILALRPNDDSDDIFQIKGQLARAHENHGSAERAIELYTQLLAMDQATDLSLAEKVDIRNRLALLSIEVGDFGTAATIYANFLDAAGDAASVQGVLGDDFNPSQQDYISKVRAATKNIAIALAPVQEEEVLVGADQDRLAAAAAMTKLGGYYATLPEAEYAAAGLLSAAYKTQKTIQGPGGQDSLRSLLLLGPIYQKIGRLKEAEDMYLAALHAQEKKNGSNDPSLSLYIRLLADVYSAQGYYTQAEALNKHIHEIFSDAFGARRYASNQQHDRRMDVNRPVSIDFPLSSNYSPQDLVKANDFDIPLSKNGDLEEMSFRMAEELSDDHLSSMPVALRDLLSHCGNIEGERLSLRSGYRSYATQQILYRANGAKGTVTEPGTSEHQLGLAVDIDVNRRMMRASDRAYQCFEEYGWQFGFILSYPQGNSYLPGADTFEPWHWRYVGRQTALLYREAGPINRPQEFLASLPCYQERAAAGIWFVAGETDVCLQPKKQQTAAKINPLRKKTG